MSFRGWRGYFEAFVATAASTCVAWFLYPLLANANLGLVLLIAVLVAAIRGGVGPALFASVLSFLLFNFLFTEPRFTFKVTYAQDVLTIVFFLVVATVTGQLAVRVRRQLESAQESHKRIALLEEFSRRLTGIVSLEDLSRVLDNYLNSTLGLRAVLVRKHYSPELVVVARPGARRSLSDSEREAAEWAFHHRENAGFGTGTLPRSHSLFLPIVGKNGCLAVLGVRPVLARRSLDQERMKLLVAMRDQAGIALERLLLTAEIEQNRLLIETDKLRSALLSSVSHDLRTPLVSIKGAASAMLELGPALDADDQRELLENVLDQTERLNRYVQNLLDMTRLGYGVVKPELDWCDVRDIAAAATRNLKSLLGTRQVRVCVPGDQTLVLTDNRLLEQVLVNLLENATKYSPVDAEIRIEARRDLDHFELAVVDQGPGIPREERARVFDMFHRAHLNDQRSLGTGMGLAICRGMVESLGGSIEVAAPGAGTGTRIVIRLPQTERQPLIEVMES